MEKKVIKTSLILILIVAIITLVVGWHRSFDASEPPNLAQCTNHIDKNIDMVCDACQKILSQPEEVPAIVETVADDGAKVSIQGYMPNEMVVSSKKVEKETAVDMAKKHIKDITSEDILYAYDISMLENEVKYQPEDYNETVKVTISNLDILKRDNIRLLHILDDQNYELIKPSELTKSSISFVATSFSTYIVVSVESYDVTFSGTNYTVQNVKGKELTDGATILNGIDFNFVIIPNEGYGITTITATNSQGTSISGFNETGNITGKTCNISSVTQDITITVTTVDAPIITSEPVTNKVKVGEQGIFSVTATNTTGFEWQYRENENDYWKTVTDIIAEVENNGQTSTLTTIATTMAMNGYEFRCLLTNSNFTGDNSVKTDRALLQVSEDTITTVTEYKISDSDKNYSVDGIFYSTLEEAYSNIEGAYGEIVVEKDNEDASTFTVEAGKEITLNTNGKTITKTTTYITNNGILTIVGNGLIRKTTNESQSLIGNTGTLNIISGEIINGSSAGFAIESWSEGSGKGNINITDGIISSSGDGAILHNGTGKLIIGTSGDTVSTKVPEIIATTYAIESIKDVYFYDGLLKGAIKAISGDITETEEKYAVYKETKDGYENAYLKKNITDVSLNPTSIIYTGAARTVSVTVKWNGNILVQNKDYELAYSNNINAGTAIVTVTGSGDYTGNVEESFEITKATLGGSVKVKGTNTYGETLTADISNVSPQADSYTYEWWYSDSENATSGEKIAGATSKSYKIGKGLIDKYIGVTVIAKKGNYFDKTYSDITDLSNGTAKVSKANRTITLAETKFVEFTTTGTLNFAYSGEDVKADAVSSATDVATIDIIDGTLGGTIIITPVKIGESVITVNVPESDNYKSISDTCVVTIDKGTLGGSIKIVGINTIGNILTADVSNVSPQADSYTYEWWYAEDENATSGTKIEGATDKDYTIGNKLVGKYIGVTVVATKANYNSQKYTDITDETNRTATVSSRNYSVNGEFYDTLEMAYNEITGNSGIIVVEESNEDSSTFIVEAGKEIILNTNGKTITKTALGLTNEGTFTIEGEGTIETLSAKDNVIDALINNTGTLNINEVTLINRGNKTQNWNVIRNSGTLNVNDGIITTPVVSDETIPNTIGARTIENSNGILNIAEGQITNECTGCVDNDYAIEILGNNSNVAIAGGTIKGIVMHKDSGELIIGNASNVVIKTSPIIEGNEVAIESVKGFKFYDGTLKGSEKAISGDVIEKPEGYTIYKETISNLENAYLKKEITDVEIGITSTIYTGNEIVPDVIVKWNGNKLNENSDYTVKIVDNKNVGTATVTVTGINDYTGTVIKTFEIIKGTMTGEVTIIGTNTYNETLTVDVSKISPQADSYTYQWWYSEVENATTGELIEDATSQTYTIGSGLADKYIGVTVIATKTNYTPKEFTDITDAEKNETEKVSKADRTLTIDKELSLIIGEEGTINYSYTGEDVTATVTLPNNSVVTATVNDETLLGKVIITPIAVGESIIIITIPESTNYNSISDKCTLLVSSSVPLPPEDFKASVEEYYDEITLTWTQEENQKYELFYKSETDGWVLLADYATSPYRHVKLESNIEYEYRIRTYNVYGRYSEYVYTKGSTAQKVIASGDVILDTQNPIISDIEITPQKKYIRSGDKIEISFKVTDENYYKEYTKEVLDAIIVRADGTTIEIKDIQMTKQDITNGEACKLIINSFPYTSQKGELVIIIQKDSFMDKALNGNDTKEIETGMIVYNSNITTTPPTLEKSMNIVTCNQTTDIEPDNVIIYYEYRKSGEQTYTRVTKNQLDNLEPETDYEIRTLLQDVTGNIVPSESVFIKTNKYTPVMNFEVVSPATGTYVVGTEITIEGTFSDEVRIVEIPKLIVKFGNGEEIELTGTLNQNGVTYKYTIAIDDLGLLEGVKYVGSVKDADDELIEYNTYTKLEGNKITARTGVKLKENGIETYYPYIQDGIDNANTLGNKSEIIVLKTEEINETIVVADNKNIEIDLNGKDIIITNDIGIKNEGSLTIKDDIGTSEIKAIGTDTVTTIENDGTLNIITGQIKTELINEDGTAIAINNNGTTTIGIDDGNIDLGIPYIESDEYGIVNNGVVNFNDGVMIGNRDKSYSGDLVLPAGYNIVTEFIGNDREKTYIGIDKIPPIINHRIITKGWRNDYIEVEIYAYDAETGIRLVKVDNDEIEMNDLTETIKLTENKEYILYAEDNAGNGATGSIIIETLDKEAPIISGVTMQEELTNDSTEVIVEVQDLASGLAGVILKTIDEIPTADEEWIEFNMYPTSKQFVSLVLTKNSTYYCFAKDRAGNISKFDDVIKVTNIDKVKPTIESVKVIKDEGKDYVTGKAVIVEVIANDNIGVAEVLITNELLDNDAVRESSDWKAYNQYVVHELPIGLDGYYPIYIWVKDAKGNISVYASTTVELKALIVGDNEYDYTGSAELYNKAILTFRAKDQNYDFETAVENGEVILRLTLGDKVIRNITTGITVSKIKDYDGRDDDYEYEGEIYELIMQNLPSTGNLSLVLKDNALIDLARNYSKNTVCLTDMFVDNNPPTIEIRETGNTDAEGNLIKEITVRDKENYLLNYIEIITEGTKTTHELTDGKLTIGLKNGAKIIAYDKAGNEGIHKVGASTNPNLSVTPDIEFVYGGTSRTISYSYDGDGIVTAISNDTNIANVSINTDTKQITISPVNAGNCEITIKSTETENYAESKQSILVTVKPKAVTMSWSADTFTYDKTRKTVTATVTNAIVGDTVTAIGYTNNNKINAGEYRAEVVELNDPNYTTIGGTNITLDWRINKANRTLTLNETANEQERSTKKTITFTYTGERTEIIATPEDPNIVAAKVNLYDGSGELIVEGLEYGTTRVTVKIPESTNYNEVSKSYDASVFVKVRVYFDTDGGNEIASKIVRYNEAYGSAIETPVKTDCTFKAWYTDKTYTSEVTSDTIVSNIQQHTLYAKWKKNPTATVSMSGYTYGGTKSSPRLNGDAGNGAVTYYYNTTGANSGGTLWTNVTSATSLNAGTYYMYATIAETEEYAAYTTPAVSFTIAKANGYISINPTTRRITGTGNTTTTTVTSSHGGTISVSSSTSGISGSASGTTVRISGLSSKANGSTINVTITCGATTNYKAASATLKITIDRTYTCGCWGACYNKVESSGAWCTFCTGQGPCSTHSSYCDYHCTGDHSTPTPTPTPTGGTTGCGCGCSCPSDSACACGGTGYVQHTHWALCGGTSETVTIETSTSPYDKCPICGYNHSQGYTIVGVRCLACGEIGQKRCTQNNSYISPDVVHNTPCSVYRANNGGSCAK